MNMNKVFTRVIQFVEKTKPGFEIRVIEPLESSGYNGAMNSALVAVEIKNLSDSNLVLRTLVYVEEFGSKTIVRYHSTAGKWDQI